MFGRTHVHVGKYMRACSKLKEKEIFFFFFFLGGGVTYTCVSTASGDKLRTGEISSRKVLSLSPLFLFLSELIWLPYLHQSDLTELHSTIIYFGRLAAGTSIIHEWLSGDDQRRQFATMNGCT